MTTRSRQYHFRKSLALMLLAFGMLAAPCLCGPARAEAVSAPGAGAARPLYLDPNRPVGERVDNLVSRMTMEEKAFQLTNSASAIPRLDVPAYNWWSEALHGVIASPATVFPQAIGLAATWNAPLHHQIATAIGTEGRVHYDQSVAAGRHGMFEGLDFWAPNINIFRDPRWGRGQETYGEDPFLTGRMAVAYVTGMQGDNPKYLRVVATPKHFAVHSGPEPLRHMIDVKVSLHDLEDTYLPAFRAAVVEGHARSVMCAYNSINGQPACANTFLLEATLRGAWKFDGYVVSDCGAITDIRQGHHFVATQPEAAAVSMQRGTDNDCGGFGDADAYLAAMKSGLLSQQAVDTALKRLFRARFDLGMFDPPERVPYARTSASELDSAAHRRLALEAARQSLVLLKNDGVLPLRPATQRIAVIGPLAASERVLLGNYNGTPSRATTVLDGLRRQFPRARVQFASGTTFLRAPGPVPAGAFRTADGKPGLTVAYYPDKDLTGAPVVIRTDPQLSFGFGSRHRLPAQVEGKDYSARWTGTLTASDSAPYTLTLRGSGGARLWLDDKPVLDDWKETRGFPPAERKAEVQLQGGRPYRVRFEYFHTVDPRAPAGAARFLSGFSLLWTKHAGDDIASALAAARDADVVVAVVGLTSDLEGEEMGRRDLPEGFKGGDRTRLDLPRDEETLIEAAKATGKPLVVVLMSGSALAVSWADQHADAILQAWYPGEEGGAAVAETLAGVNNPAGRLPVTFYRSVDDLPPFEDYAMAGRTYRYCTKPVLYPFGYGLSYTDFAYSGLRLSAPRLRAGQPLDVTVAVRNTGRRAGDEVAELYLTPPQTPGAPRHALRGFQRVHLAPGQTRRLRFTLDARDLSFVNPEGERRVSAGTYRLWAGGGQPGTGRPGAEAALVIEGEQRLPR